MKKSYIKIIFTMIFLLTVFAAMGSIVQAASTEQYTVSIEYNANACAIEVLVDGTKINPTEVGGQKYLVDKNHANFKIQITPNPGYSLSPLINKDTQEQIASSEADGLTYTPPLDKDTNFQIIETPKLYTIKELGVDGKNHTLVFENGIIQYYYASTDAVILPKPTLEGYDFKGWLIKDDAGNSFPCGTIDGDIVFSTNNYPEVGDVFYAQPIWAGKPQTVTRYDYEYDPTGETNIPVNYGNQGVTNTTSWFEPNGTENVSGLYGNATDAELNKNGTVKATFDKDGYKKYIGYYDFTDYANNSDYYTTLARVKTDIDANKVYRYYVPITYKIVCENVDDTTPYDGLVYVYNKSTSLVDLKPERTGYNFAGWKVYIQKGGVKTDVTASIGNLGLSAIPNLTLNARELCLADGNENNEIILEATWAPKTYTVSYDWNGADEDKITFTGLTQYVYDTDLVILDPDRPGYTFKGWELTSGETTSTLDSLEGKITLLAKAYTDDITLKAIWQANEYTVTFDENLAQTPGTESIKVTFDSLPNLEDLVLPVREGHMFLGFTLTKDGTDLIIDGEGSFLRSVWDIPADTTLYAKWGVISYNVTVNVTDAKVWLNDVEYTGEPISIPYGTKVAVRVECNDGYKVTNWEGSAVTHEKNFTTDFTMGAGDTTLDIAVLPVISAPSFTVDYINELFLLQNAQNGSYRIKCGAEALQIRVNGSDLYVNDKKVTQIAIPNSFFGNTAEITMYGDGITWADSDPIELALAKRPEAPVLNDHISGYVQDGYSITVNINLGAGYTYEYEFALYYNNDGTGMVLGWMTPDGEILIENANGAVTFHDVYPGTQYYVYIRVKATNEAPHGELQILDVKTPYDSYFNQIIDDLNRLKDGGEMVDALIEAAKAEINALEKYTSTFYNSLNGIYNRTVDALPFAKEQDAKIAELRKLRDELVATGEFDDSGKLTLNTICESGVAQIKNAETKDEIGTAYNAACAEMKLVKIKYLTYDAMNLTSFAGLSQGTKLFLSRITDITAITNSVDSAIKVGKVSVAAGNSMTLAEAADILSALDVMAGYDMRLSNGTTVLTSFDGSFELRLLLPEDLRNATGLQVAYYDEKTGVLEVLSTARDGNYLVFTANEICDFVILGDPTMNLTGFILSLGLILLCQLIAIVILLVRRSKSAKEARRYSLALPMILAIRFMPDNALTVVLVLGGLVVLCQIILMYLLLSSNMIYRRKRKKTSRETVKAEPDEEESLPAMAETENADDIPEDPYAEETYEDIEDGNAQDDLVSYAAVDAIFDESESSEPEEELVDDYGSDDYEADENAYAEDDPYGFIEPAANPRYSLPEDEELAEDEDVGSEEPAEAAEWAYDDEANVSEYDPVVEELSEADAQEADNADWQGEEAVASVEWAYDDGNADLDEDADVAAWAEDADAESLSESDPFDADNTASNETTDETESDETDSDKEEADDEPEFYIEPDARGDEAPAPEYPDDEDEESKKYDGYEE